jgi:RNA-binding motif X-linked protein 2
VILSLFFLSAFAIYGLFFAELTFLRRYGEVMDAHMPKDKETGKPRGFAFLMYEDQRSTVLAVDNLNGAKVLGRTLRVDHVKNYKQPKIKTEDGEWVEPEEQSLNAKPQAIEGRLLFSLFLYAHSQGHTDSGVVSDSSVSTGASIDPEDPMRDYLIAQRREAAKAKKSKGKRKHKNETPEERHARKAKKREKKERRLKSAGMKGVEELLNKLSKRGDGEHASGKVVYRDRPRHRELRSMSPKRHEHSRSRERSAPKDDDRLRKRSRLSDEEERYYSERHYR